MVVLSRGLFRRSLATEFLPTTGCDDLHSSIWTKKETGPRYPYDIGRQ